MDGKFLIDFLVIRHIKRMKEKIIDFIDSQIRQICKGGFLTLIKKAYLLLKNLCETALVLLVIPFVLIVRMLRPLILIRFGYLQGDRIGSYALNTEFYLCNCDVDKEKRRKLDIFYHTGPICNRQLEKMWNRTMRVCFMARWLDKANSLLPGGKEHENPIPEIGRKEGKNIFMPAHLSFTPDEEQFGMKELRRLGMSDNNPFICFHARDSAYMDAMFADGDWSYHDYRDSNINDYIPVIEELIHKGYFAIRMGAIAKERLNITHPKVIDYAVNGRTDFLDIYLSAKCEFFVCTSSGIFTLPAIFRKPITWVNFIPLKKIYAQNKDSLFIPKKLWLRKEHRFLSFREIFDSKIGGFIRTQDYEKLGIKIIENTSQEIKAVVVEMNKRLKNKWQTTKEDEEMQKCFWSLFKPKDFKEPALLRIGTEFLRQNKELLK